MRKTIRQILCVTAILAAVLLGAAVFQKTVLADEYSVTYQLTTLEGETITEKSYAGRVQLLVFYNAEMGADNSPVCWTSGNFLSTLPDDLDCGWIAQNDVMLILVPGTDVTDAQVQKFIDSRGVQIDSDNVVFTKAAPSVMWSLCANDTIRFTCCIPVLDGQRLDYQDGVDDLKDVREMMGEYVDMEAMYQVVQVTAKYDYEAAFKVLELVNQERAAQEPALPPLTMDKELLECAMQRAAELSLLFEHTRPSGARGLDISDLAWGENIAAGPTSAAMVMDSWIESDGHHDNMINSRWTSIGVGAVVVNDQFFWCQLFGEKLENTAKASDYSNHTDHPKITVLDRYLEDGDIPQAYHLDTSYEESDESSSYTKIPVGETAQIHLSYFYKLGSCTDILTEIYPGGLTYSSSDPSVATVSSKGLVTAKKEGKVTITLRSKYSSPRSTDLFWVRLTVVKALPVITAQPKDAKVSMGSTASFKVSASGENLKYQWYYMKPHSWTWTAVSAASGKTANYKVTATTARSGYQYYCEITNGSHPVKTETVTLLVTPAITTQPTTQKVSVGTSAHFSVSAKGPGLFSYQWYYRTSAGGSWKKVTASGGTFSNYFVTATVKRDGYQYHCKVSNSNGYVFSKTVTLRVMPRIIRLSYSPTVRKGQTATFSVEAEGKGLTYQWYYRTSSKGSWKAVTAAAGKKATYKFTAKAKHNGYQYRCKVKNSAGYVYCSVISLKVK